MSKGLLIVLSGPSGAGKGTVRAALMERQPELRYGISVTTRARRAHEMDGVHYYFIDREDFLRRRDRGEFVEWAEVYGNYYATPREPMETWLAEGHDVLIEKDIQGAMTLKRAYPDACFVFILPPSLEELRRRITARGSESAEARNQRLASASHELTYLDRYDYAVVNDRVDAAVDKLLAIIKAEKCRVSRQPDLIEKIRSGGAV